MYRDEEISKGSEYKSAVQIRPQHVKISLRVGQPFDMNMQYVQAKDYPVDLYYLMDLSKSMEDDKVPFRYKMDFKILIAMIPMNHVELIVNHTGRAFQFG